MANIELRLTPKPPEEEGRHDLPGGEESRGPQGPRGPYDHPIAGYMAVGFGLIGIFTDPLVFVPLSVICSVVALFKGQTIWGVMGLLLSILGVLTSPIFLLFLGLRVLMIYLDGFYDWIGFYPADISLPEV